MKLRGIGAQILIALVAFLFASTAAQAQFGRISIYVVDDGGKPIEGVKITATSDELGNFEQVETTNKKGKATFSFSDATKLYNFHFEHDAYPPLDQQFKPQVRTSINREVTLSKAATGGTVPDETTETRVVFTAAEEVFNEGVRALQGGDLATAEASFASALEKDPDMVLAHSALAGVYVQQNQPQKALDAVERLLELDPGNPRGVRIRYEAHSALGNKKEAAEALEELKKLDTGGDTVTFIYNEGVAATKVGDYKTAKERFLEALELQPDLSAAIGALAIIYIKEGENEKAVEMAERHLELVPDDKMSLRVRFDAYRALGDKAKTAEALEALKEADPEVLISQFMEAGVAHFNNGDGAAAQAAFQTVLDLDPNHARAHYRMGLALINTGEIEKAKEHLRKFTELAPANDPELPVAKDMLSAL